MITLLTDFGHRDAFVGAMKGVIGSIAPDVTIVDISHEIPPQSIRRAGLVLGAVLPYFPRGSVHVVVVDPGVGSRRKILAFSVSGSVVLAPDNGLIGYATTRKQVRDVWEVRCRELFLEPVSQTFHGRDIFAPVAAHLAADLAVRRVGPRVKSYRREELPRARRIQRGGYSVIRGEVIDVDVFGNLLTSVFLRDGETVAETRISGKTIPGLARHYASVKRRGLLVIVGSTGRLEISLRDASAAAELDADVGERVEIVVS